MATRYIYLSEELNSRLKQEPNASELIQRLLTAHYESTATDKQLSKLSGEELAQHIEKLKKKIELSKQLEALG